MPIRVDSAARFLCKRSNWTLSNLSLQKLLYLAQVEHADRCDGAPLVEAGFQAWDYGPVIPSLYQRLRMFGGDSVEDVFYDAREIRENSNSERSLLNIWREFGSAAPGELIELTHWERGAWAQRYEPGVKGIGLSQDDIVTEAANRHRYRGEWRRLVAA